MKFAWSELARSELRSIDKKNAIRILEALADFGQNGVGDIKLLKGEWEGLARLRVGDYRGSPEMQRSSK